MGSACCQDVRKGRKVFGAGEAYGPQVSLPASTLLLSPEAGGRHGCLCFIGVIPGPLRRRDAEEALFPRPRYRVVGARSLGPPALGKEWVTPDIWVVFCRPFPPERPPILTSPCGGWAALELGDSKKRGLELAAVIAGPGLASPHAAGAAHPFAPLLLSRSLHLASRAGSRPHQRLQAVWPVCQ